MAVLVTALAGWFAARLQVNADLRALLPSDHPVVVNLEKIETSFGSTNSVNFIAKGGTLEGRHAYTDALAAELRGHELLREVEHGLAAGYFAERAMFYLSDEELEDLQYRVDAWNHYELCTRAPENCPSNKPDEAAPKKLRGFIENKRDRAYELTGFRDRYEREGIEAEVVLAYPHESASRLEAADTITDAMRAIALEVYEREAQPWSDTGMEYNVLGSYITKSDEHRTVLHDMGTSGAFGVIGVVLVLYVLFRSTRAVLVLILPLSCGLIWSLAMTQVLLGRLNSMTATISTVLMGVGIDAGIHFYSRARRHRAELDDGDAITTAFRGLVVPLLVASSTTVGAFASMASSDFPAFREFGIIAAVGVVLCLLSMVTVLPALAILVGIKRPEAAPKESAGMLSRMIMARPGALFFVLVVSSAAAVWGARKVSFEYNVRELQSKAGRLSSEADAAVISKIFGKDIHAAVLVRDTVDEVRATVATARTRHDARKFRGESVVAELLAVTDLMPDPALDMADRGEKIEELHDDYEDLLEKLRERAVSDAEHPKPDAGEVISVPDVDLLEAMLSAEPFTVDDLPESLLSKLRAEDGRWAIYAYPAFDAANMKKGLLFSEELGSYLDNSDESIFVGEAILYAAMFVSLKDESPVVLGMASVLIAGLVFWQLRSLRWTLMTLLPLALSLWWTIAIMGTIDLRFTLFNLPILPAILGIGVDNGVYLTAAIRRQARTAEGLTRALKETGGAILAATATTAVGFAAFMVADSGGVRGIGALAVLGIVIAAAAALLVLPTVANVARRRIRR